MNIGREHAPLPARLPRGFVVGGCVVDGWLRDGGMAAIYRARRTLDDRRVALKLQLPSTAGDAAICTRFDREAEVLARANGSPHVVELYDAGQLEDGRRYFMMEWVEGENLEEVLDFLRNEDQRLPLVRACRIGRDVARGLVELHEHGVLHLDLKPANVMVAQGDGGDEVKLVDFGIAADLQEGTVAGSSGEDGSGDESVMGTRGYMAPEQVQGAPASAAFDVYALGVLLFEAITGNTVPPHGWSAETLPRVEKLRRGVPAALVELVRACMDFDPGRRPASAAVVEAELVRIIAGLEAGGARKGVRTEEAVVRTGKTVVVPQSSVASGPARTGATELMTHEEVLSRSGLTVPREVVEAARQKGRALDARRKARRRGWGIAIGGAVVMVVVVGAGAGAGWLVGGREEVSFGNAGAEARADAGAVHEEVPAEAEVKAEAEATIMAGVGPQVVESAQAVGSQGIAQEEKPAVVPAAASRGETEVTQGAEIDTKAEERPAVEVSGPIVEDEVPPSEDETRDAGPSPEACRRVRTQANEAKRARMWRKLLKQTAARECWTSAAQKLERKRLRVEAYAELGELRKCIAEGGKLRDPEIDPRVRFCRNKLGK